MCYDRIIIRVISIIIQSFGTDKSVVIFWSKTVEQASYNLKKTISINYYTHIKEFPIHATRQGLSNSWHWWIFISSTLFIFYDKKNHRAKLYLPNINVSVACSMIGIIDDTKCHVKEFFEYPQPLSSKIIDKTQHNSQL